MNDSEFRKEYAGLSAGMKQLVDEAVKQRTYRDGYNKRPTVKAKRAAYNKKRNAMQRVAVKQYRERQNG